ncbi:DEAD/DEAH box helicase [Phanerochaete sordida]|uniref:DNA 3'-5' helicase n=1 Tax=Phanerochaete sordida TaxID=48140 RepID=A0A9P3LMM6_9APHY|nr:DEAD/DEAH box helicase [Phanerochaete sordida]
MRIDTITTENVTAVVCEGCKIKELRPFQVPHIVDMSLGKSLVLVAAPGSGKTIIMAGPLLVAQAMGQSGIAFVVVPSKILVDQQAASFGDFGLRTLAINEDTVRSASLLGRDLWAELAAGDDVRVAVVTPWMIASDRLYALLRDAKFKNAIRWLDIDEVHLCLEKLSVWSKPYEALQSLRTRLPSSTVWAVFTGTATIKETRIIASGLGFAPGTYVDARYSVDRPNLKYTTRFFAHSVSGYEFYDLAWLIPYEMKNSAEIPTTLIFCDTIELGVRLMAFLDDLIPDDVPDRLTLIMPCNSLFKRSFRLRFRDGMEAGRIRIGICTETCTYGVDIRNVRRVITFGQPKSFAKMKQELCRAGRDGLPARVYCYAPPWMRDVPFYEIKGKQAKEDLARREALDPVVRDWFNACGPHVLNPRCPRQIDMDHNSEAFHRPEQCCYFHIPDDESEVNDELNAKHLAHRQSKLPPKVPLPRSDGTYSAVETAHRQSLSAMLKRWRQDEWDDIRGPDEDFPSEVFLPQHRIDRLLAKAHICTCLERLRLVMAGWNYLESHGEKLLAFITPILEAFRKIIGERQYETLCASTDSQLPPAVAADGLPAVQASSESSAAQSSTSRTTGQSDASTSSAPLPRLVLKIRMPTTDAAATPAILSPKRPLPDHELSETEGRKRAK